MTETNNLLNLITNCFPAYRHFNGFDFLIFSLISIVLVMILLGYYNKISTGEKSILNDFSEQPFYQSKDILLQEKALGSSLAHIPVNSSLSIFAKVVLIILALVIFCTPLHEFLILE